MRTRPLGKTGLNVSQLALGTWSLSGDGYGAVDAAEQDAVIDRARALGITLFETADSYARGEMEKKLGKRLKEDDKALVCTKLGTDRKSTPPKKCFRTEFLKTAFERSRERLDRDIDIVLLHNPSTKALEKGEATDLLKELKEKKEIRAWGVSAGNAEVGKKAIEAGAEVVQIAYNAFNSKDLSELEEQAREQEVGVLARSVLAHGLLCGYWSRFRTFPYGDHRRDRWSPDQLRQRVTQLSALRSLISEDTPTIRAVALRYALANEVVSAVVIGPHNSVQLDQLVREAAVSPPYLSEEQLSKLSARLSDVGVLSE